MAQGVAVDEQVIEGERDNESANEGGDETFEVSDGETMEDGEKALQMNKKIMMEC